ncbi:carbamoyl phosphate synthase small subunit [Candidatus Vidania fulgoroideae]|nr:carbamoyl phosphate synthase small subunit [Candidatus Vidania fulgoroideae]WDR79328.1 carbamoyl phosphate synthase small subunit [Candidatus Vidania fulgoroideae]
MNLKFNCKIIFSDGEEFFGKSLCYKTNIFSEIVFNTSNLGYEEIITDPSYSNQSLVLTTPHVGNTGVNFYDSESERIWLSCLITRNIFKSVSNNFRFVKRIFYFLKKNKIILLSDFDTRSITKKITKGYNYVCILHNKIYNVNKKIFIFSNILEKIPYIKYSSTKISYLFCNFNLNFYHRKNFLFLKKVIVIDFGLKISILKNLVKEKILPLIVNYKVLNIINLNFFDGIVLSNGPGNPKIYKKIIKYIKKIKKPILAICFGHQIYSLSKNFNIKKLIFGHHGSNHPINFKKKCFISSQNHNYFCKTKKTKIFSLLDGTNQGFSNKRVISFQGHPEASPGPNDFLFLFKNFFKILK